MFGRPRERIADPAPGDATVDPGAGNFFLGRDGYTAALPMSSPTRNNTKKTKNKTRAIPSAVPAMPPNPRTPATIATIKKTNAQ
jgi:hypothetical protein